MKHLKKAVAVALITSSSMAFATLSGTMDALKNGDLEGAFGQFFNQNTLTELTATPATEAKKVKKQDEVDLKAIEAFFTDTANSLGSMLNSK